MSQEVNGSSSPPPAGSGPKDTCARCGRPAWPPVAHPDHPCCILHNADILQGRDCPACDLSDKAAARHARIQAAKPKPSRLRPAA